VDPENRNAIMFYEVALVVRLEGLAYPMIKLQWLERLVKWEYCT
jgi:hypothetical protein